MTDPSHLEAPEGAVAVVGLDCRVPGAPDHHKLWRMLLDGAVGIEDIPPERLREAGVPAEMLADERYVRRAAVVAGADLFDASFFYISTREAERMDPQMRLLLESCWSALEHSGHDSERYPGRIGVFAGSLASSYLLNNVLTGPAGFNGSIPRMRQDLHTLMGNDPNYLATRVSYHLNLTGPGISVQTACSTSLVAVHLATQSLLAQECDVALAGGVALRFPQEAGYLYEPDGIGSATGMVRPFDNRADGTLFGNGVGVVVLKRLTDAIAEGDTVWGVIRGSAVGNDGADRAGYTAPGVSGQAAVLAEALAVADVAPETVSYLEAHGTGTRLGDPIELAAISQAYRPLAPSGLAIGSVKANVGHLSTAAGVIGLIKCLLMLRHRTLVGTPNFTRWNPQCENSGGAFRVSVRTEAWPAGSGPLRCAVTSTGMGGTTAHVVLEEARAVARKAPEPCPVVVLPLSAKSPAALEAARHALANALEDGAVEPVALEDAAYTLATGRRTFNYRAVVTAPDRAATVQALRSADPRMVRQDSGQPADRAVVLLFPGQGAQYPAMGQGWYQHLPVFREVLDDCARQLRSHLGLDLRDALYSGPRRHQGELHDVGDTRLTQPALFTVEYALAQQWMAWGVRPAALVGHSVGEYVAAALAGVLELPDALRVVVERGRLMGELPRGAMASVMLSPDELSSYLAAADEPVELAAVNERTVCTVSGRESAVRALIGRLNADGVAHRKIATSHAFHSAMMDPAVEPFTELLRSVPLHCPRIPMLSNRTGGWLRDEDATDPAYWGGQLRDTVRFADNLATVLASGDHVFLEVGPGQALASFARRHPDRETGVPVIASAARVRDADADLTAVHAALAQLWTAGLPVDWAGYYAGRQCRRVPLPTYPFERERYWVEPGAGPWPDEAPAIGKLPLDEWFTVPVWRPAIGNTPAPAGRITESVLLFIDSSGVAERLAKHAFGGVVLRVQAGSEYRRDAHDRWTVRADSEEDHARLVSELVAEGLLPRRIAHLWSTAPLPAGLGRDRFEEAQRRGLYSVIALVKALTASGVVDRLRLDLVSAGAYAPGTDEPGPTAELVTLAVAAKVVGQEHGNLTARHFDLPAEPDDRSLRLLSEELMRTRRPEVATALRGNTRWITDLEPVHADWSEPGPGRLRDRGIYLITGGLGEIGSTIANWLHRQCGARLALLTHELLPPRHTWDTLLAERDAVDDTVLRINRLRALEAIGAELLLVQADVADAKALGVAVNRVRERFGALHGVVHAAGLPSEKWDRTITTADVEQCRWHFIAKAYGQMALEEALAGCDIDFVLLLSSLAGVLGGLRLLGYGAANHFMDAAAERANRGLDRAVWISAAWDVWQHHQDEKRAISAIGRNMDNKAIQPVEGLEAIRRLLMLRDVSHVAISTWDMAHRLDRWVRREQSEQDLPAATADVSGGDEVVDQVLALVRKALGSPELPPDGDIFEHGGDSLLIVRLLSDVRGRFAAEVALADVLSEPTPRALAALVQQRLDSRAAGHRADDADEIANLARELAELDEAEIERLLTEVAEG